MMKTTASIELLAGGVLLIIVGMIASNPEAQQASLLLARLPTVATPVLFGLGALVGVLGFMGVLGVFRPRHTG